MPASQQRDRAPGPGGPGRAGPLAWGAALALGALLPALGCTAVQGSGGRELPLASPPPIPSALDYESVDPSEFSVTPESITVGDSFLLDVYTFFQRKDYSVSRVEFPGHESPRAVAHWFVPPGDGPHPTVLVFPILAGNHLVSELVAKALVGRGFAVAQLERKAMDLEGARDPGLPAHTIREAVRDARRLLDWLELRPEVDPTRIASAGVSMGSLLACTLQGVDPRVGAGFYLLTGGGVAELLYDSAEKPVRAFRDRVIDQHGYADREAFVAGMRPLTREVDPLTTAGNIDPRSVLLISGRLDRVIPPDRTQALWEALGEPEWIRLPVGHYQSLPFLWWAISRGATHLREFFEPPQTPN